MRKRMIFYQKNKPRGKRKPYDLWVMPFMRKMDELFLNVYYNSPPYPAGWSLVNTFDTIDEFVKHIDETYNFKYVQSKNKYQIEQIKEFQDD